MNLKFWKWGESDAKPVSKKEWNPTGSLQQSHVKSYDGEKNLGELGPIIHYIMDYYNLSARSWQMYIESDIAQTIVNKYCMWIVDTGLKLRCNPAKVILASKGINITEDFNEAVEARFAVWSKIKTVWIWKSLQFGSGSSDAC